MKRITNDQARIRLQQRIKNGQHVDSRLLREVESGEVYLDLLAHPDDFLNLIWSQFNGIRFLAPADLPRTLRDVGQRLIDSRLTLSDLTIHQGMTPPDHDPKWFAKCALIAGAFSYEQFGELALTPANEGERRQSPGGKFYIYDGTHKSLVLSVLLLRGDVAFQPIEALVIFPRRN